MQYIVVLHVLVEIVQVGDFLRKFVLVEIDSTSTNFAQYDFFQVPKIVLSGDPLYNKTNRWSSWTQAWIGQNCRKHPFFMQPLKISQ